MKFAQLTVHGQILQKYDCVIKINNLISRKQDRKSYYYFEHYMNLFFQFMLKVKLDLPSI